MLSEHLFKKIVQHTPLISIDLVVRNKNNEILLGKRLNRSAQGYWFVPGGRILKDESIPDAFVRITKNELGMARKIQGVSFLGVYEHHYPDNFSEEDFSTHYIVLAFELNFHNNLAYLPPQQHGQYRWWGESEILDSPEVHRHTQWYMQAERGIKC